MMHLQELAQLHKEHAQTPMLSVYVDGSESDVSERTAWRRRLSTELHALERSVRSAQPEESESLSLAARELESTADTYTGFLPADGWALFATPEGIEQSDLLPSPVRTIAAWQRGPVLTPYLRVLEAARPLRVVLLDHWRARLFRRRDGTLTQTRTLEVDRALDDFSDIGVMKSAQGATGVRGATGRDAARRSLAEETQRLVRETAAAIAEEFAEEDWLVLGGPNDVLSSLEEALPAAARGRTYVASGLHIDISPKALTVRLDELVEPINDLRYRPSLDSLIEAARPGGKGLLGVRAVWRALKRGAVDTLVISRAFADGRLQESERLVAAAIDQGGRVLELGGHVGTRLDEVGEGVAARLRFPVA